MTTREAIQILAGKGDELYCRICTVDSVNAEKRTISCTPIDGSAPLHNVKLQANQSGTKGVTIFPVEKSYVVVAFLDKVNSVVVLTEKVDKICVNTGTGDGGEDTIVVDNEENIVFHGGENLGIVKVQAMTDTLADIVTVLNGLVASFDAHTHTCSGPGGPSYPTTPYNKTAKPIEINNYKNDKIKH